MERRTEKKRGRERREIKGEGERMEEKRREEKRREGERKGKGGEEE